MSTTARYWQLVHLSVSQKIKIQQSELAKYAELEIWDRAQREAARRRKSDWKDNFGGSNSAQSNATWRMNCVSLHSTRTVGLGCVNMRVYNFFVCGPKFTNFHSSNLG